MTIKKVEKRAIDDYVAQGGRKRKKQLQAQAIALAKKGELPLRLLTVVLHGGRGGARVGGGGGIDSD